MRENGTEMALEVTERTPSEVLLSVIGDLDLAGVPALEDEIGAHRRAGRDVVLDLRWVTFMDSNALVLLLQTTRLAQANGWSFAIRRSLPDRLARLVSVTGTARRLPFVD